MVETTRMSNTSDDLLVMAEVFAKIPSAIIIVNEQGVITKVNQSALNLLGEVNLEQRRWVEVISTVFRPRQDDGHEISTRDGRRLQVTTLPLAEGQLIQMNDLTETRVLQDKIAHMERLSSLGRMAATLAHQIRTPLSAAMLYAANLGNANLQAAARKRFQEKLVSRLEAVEAQISDILMFARSNEQAVTKIDATSLIDQTANNVTAVLAKGNAELQTICDNGPLPILGNANALTGALSNLIANAVEAGAHKIILKLVEENGNVIFSVANNGPAIPEEIRSRIFEPFFTSKSSGTGLGLAVVSAVTKVHQGILSLGSLSDEYPTVFTISVPLRLNDDADTNVSLEAIEKATAATEGVDAKAIIAQNADNSFVSPLYPSDSASVVQHSAAVAVQQAERLEQQSIISSNLTVEPNLVHNNVPHANTASMQSVKSANSNSNRSHQYSSYNNYSSQDGAFTQVEVDIPRPSLVMSHAIAPNNHVYNSKNEAHVVAAQEFTPNPYHSTQAPVAPSNQSAVNNGAAAEQNDNRAAPSLSQNNNHASPSMNNEGNMNAQSSHPKRSAVGEANAVLAAALRQYNKRN